MIVYNFDFHSLFRLTLIWFCISIFSVFFALLIIGNLFLGVQLDGKNISIGVMWRSLSAQHLRDLMIIIKSSRPSNVCSEEKWSLEGIMSSVVNRATQHHPPQQRHHQSQKEQQQTPLLLHVPMTWKYENQPP